MIESKNRIEAHCPCMFHEMPALVVNGMYKMSKFNFETMGISLEIKLCEVTLKPHWVFPVSTSAMRIMSCTITEYFDNLYLLFNTEEKYNMTITFKLVTGKIIK